MGTDHTRDADETVTFRAQALVLRSGIRSATEFHLGHPINFNKWIDTMGGPQSGNEILLERLAYVLQHLQEMVQRIPGASCRLSANRVTADVSFEASIAITFEAHQSHLFAGGGGDAGREIGVFRDAELLTRAALWLSGAAAWGDEWMPARALPLSILPPADGYGYRLVGPGQFEAAWIEIAAESDAVALSRACAHPVAALLAAATERAVTDPTALAAQQSAARERHRDRVRGCLVGGAIGDALGFPVEFWSADRILGEVGPAGVREYLALPSGEVGVVSDDTQMTLFTADALAREPGLASDPLATRNALALAYLRWFDTQQGWANRNPAHPVQGLMSERWLYARRAPGNTIMGALSQVTDRSVPVPDAQNDSKGCGTVMRSAPFGLVLRWSPDEAFAAAATAAAITHGHQVAQVAAGALALLVRLLAAGGELEQSVLATRDYADSQEGHDANYTSQALELALLKWRRGAPAAEALESLGAGWIAEEALGLAVYCALAYPAAHQIADALALAVTHSGDSDSTGAICGNILGALHGEVALPTALVAGVEGLSTIRGVADALAGAR